MSKGLQQSSLALQLYISGKEAFEAPCKQPFSPAFQGLEHFLAIFIGIVLAGTLDSTGVFESLGVHSPPLAAHRITSSEMHYRSS
jgi:hypothetical protein